MPWTWHWPSSVNAFAQPTHSEDPIQVVSAFDEALGTVLKDSVEWAVRQIASWDRAAPQG